MPVAGWYDDPEDPTQLRWWSGTSWTDRRQPREAALPSEPELPPPPPPPGGTGYSIPLDGGTGAGAGGSSWGEGADGSGSAWNLPGTPGAAMGNGLAAPPRTFVEAVRVCLTKYVDGKGRASRSEYWYFGLFQFVLDILTGGVALIFLLLPSITVSVRRLHDIGKSAWALLWILVPFLGWAILIYYAVKPGEQRVNAWG